MGCLAQHMMAVVQNLENVVDTLVEVHGPSLVGEAVRSTALVAVDLPVEVPLVEQWVAVWAVKPMAGRTAVGEAEGVLMR